MHRRVVLCILSLSALPGSTLLGALDAREPTFRAGQAGDRLALVIRGGRVLDPETGLDAVMNVGVRDGRIVRVTTEALDGARVVDATGLVVAPGFIDLHQHTFDEENGRLKVLDGVTTALEMEIGVPDVAAFLKAQAGKSLVNFGATASHPWARVRALGGTVAPTVVPASGKATNEPATDAQVAAIVDRLDAEIGAGALGVGMGLAYTPGATRREVVAAFRVAAEHHVAVHVHARGLGRIEPTSSVEGVVELIGVAASTGAPLHIVHINSTGLRDAPECLALVAGARARGLDVTTEGYPYGAGMTLLQSAMFDQGWRDRFGVDYRDVMRIDTGERLSRETFDRLRSGPPRLVILFVNPDDVVEAVMRHPLVMVASDGGIEHGKGHPRTTGTFARVLGHYVRERGVLTLMDAVRRMTLMPANRLATATPAAGRKGRVQEGADADLVVFDASTVADRATYEQPTAPSVGMSYVVVNGTLVVDGGKIVEAVAPGRAFVRNGE